MDIRVSEIHAVHEPSIGEVRHWFEHHPRLLTFPFEDLNTKLEEQITNFEQGFELYLARDKEVQVFAEKYESSKVMAWIWMNTEYVYDREVADYIKQAGELYYKKIGTDAETDSEESKQVISEIVQALFHAFRELEVPRAFQAVRENRREIVPEARVPDVAHYDNVSSDDEPGTGNNPANI
jgi:hypothetical protein